MDTLIQYLSRAFAWLLQFFDWALTELFSVVTAAFVTFLDAIPIPSWVAGAANQFSLLPPGVLYFAQALDFGTGLTIIVSAYVIRFGIRRIPLVG
jgi:hypothetical protein